MMWTFIKLKLIMFASVLGTVLKDSASTARQIVQRDSRTLEELQAYCMGSCHCKQRPPNWLDWLNGLNWRHSLHEM